MSSLHHKETVSNTSIKICNDGRKDGNSNNNDLKTADVKKELATTTGIFNTKNIQQPSTSGKNFVEEEDDCLIIFEALNNTTKCSSKKENDKRQIKNEEITGDYLKKILKEEGKEEMNEESGEDLCSLECIDEEDSNEDFDLRDMDLRVEVGENDLENIQNISNNEEKKEEEEEKGKMIKEEKEVNEERKDRENEDDEMNDEMKEKRREEERLIDEEGEEDVEEKIEDEEINEEGKNFNEDFDMRDIYFKMEVGEKDLENNLNDEEERKEKEKKESCGEVKEETGEEIEEEMDERVDDEEGDEEETGEDEETNNQIGEERRDDEIVTKEVEEEEEIKEDEEMDEEETEENEEGVDGVIEGEKAEEENDEEKIEEDLSKDEEEIGEEEKGYVSNELKEKEENPFTTSGKGQNFEEKEKGQEEDRVKDNKPKEDGCLRVILKGNSDSKEKEEKYRRILEEIRSKKQREKDENNRKMALNEGKELPKDCQTISKNKHLTSVDVQKMLGDINRMNDYTQRKFEDGQKSFEDNIPSTSNDCLTTSETTQSTSNQHLQTPRQVRASSVDVSSPSKNIQTNSKHERKLSNEIPSTTSTNIQKSKNFKKPRIDNNLNETSTETPLQRNKIKFIPLGDLIVKDRRLEKVDYCIKAINCAKQGVLLPKFKINNLINNCDKKENNEKEEEEEEIKNSDNNNNDDESTPMEIEEVGQSSNEGKHGFIRTTNFPQFERQYWGSVGNVWHPPPYPPPLAHIRPNHQPFAEDTFASNQNNLAYRSFDSQPSGDIAGNRVNVGTSSSVATKATKLTQTELSYPKDEILETNLKNKTDEITNLRSQLSKKEEELNHLNSLETSNKTLKDRLESKIKLVEECKNHMAEDGEKIKKLEKEVEELKKQNYLLELEKKNNNSKKEAKSPALIKAEDEIRQLRKDTSEQRRKTENANDQLRKSDEHCKRLTADLKHQKDRYDEWRKQTINNHKKEINEEINKISAQYKIEIERISESFSVKQSNSNANLKSQLQLKEFEIERLKAENSEERKKFEGEKQKVLDNYKKLEENLRKTHAENLELQQINNSNFEEWKRIELNRHINGFNMEIIRIKEEYRREMEVKDQKLNQSLEKERQTDKKYSELVEAAEELKKYVLGNIEEIQQQKQGSSNQIIQETPSEIKEKLEKEHSMKMKNSLRDICEEQQRIKLKKGQLDSAILTQQCVNCTALKIAFTQMNQKVENCLKSGCEICSGNRSLDSLDSQSINSSNNQPSPRTPPRNKDVNLRENRKRNQQGQLKSNNPMITNNDSLQSAGQISTIQVFNNSNDTGRQTVESATSSLGSIPPSDPQQLEISTVIENVKEEIEEVGLDAQLELQNKNLENNMRFIRSKSVAALYSPTTQTFPTMVSQANIQASSRSEDFVNPLPPPPSYLQANSDPRFNQQFNSIGNTTNQVFTQGQQNQNLQQLICSSSAQQQQQRQLIYQQPIIQQQQNQLASNISYVPSHPLLNNQQILQQQNNHPQFQNRPTSQQNLQNYLNQNVSGFPLNSAMQQLFQQQMNSHQQQQVRFPQQTFNQPQNPARRPNDPRLQSSDMYAFLKLLEQQQQQQSQSQQQQPQVNNLQQMLQQSSTGKSKSKRNK
ncbi:unnamed protein product [Meloidogyne enterolobii]|uniref:Uncharacterized protein n=1 Tax=Meloidogyne enterolobii TaxID=390850 RepID=A0ACB0XX99_MELEN